MPTIKYADAGERIREPRHLQVVFDSHAMIVDTAMGSTIIVPLESPPATTAPPSREDALAESAARTAERWSVPVAYIIRYPHWQPGDPLALPD